MNPQQLEFRDAVARRTDPDTSHNAASEISGDIANALESKVLTALKGHPLGLTNHEIVDVTRLNWNTSSPRIRPLVRRTLSMIPENEGLALRIESV